MEKALVWQEKPVVLLCKQVPYYRRTLRVSIERFFERNLQKCTNKIRSFSSKIFANNFNEFHEKNFCFRSHFYWLSEIFSKEIERKFLGTDTHMTSVMEKSEQYRQLYNQA